jgi:hypothetical protein
MERDKITGVLEDVGAVVLANACGPCIGQVCRISLTQLCIYVLASAVETRGHKGGRQWCVFCYSLECMLIRTKQF